MSKTSDNAVISNAHRLKDMTKQKYGRFSFVRGRVVDVLHTDNPNNISGTFVEYNIVIDTTDDEGTKYFNVPALTSLGGFNNFVDIVLSPTTHTFVSQPKDRRAPYNRVTNGDYVALLFLYGFDQLPIIIGGWPHPRHNGPIEEDGIVMRGEFNGIAWEINKNGGLTIEYLGGPRDKEGNLTNANSGPSSITIGSDGTITLDRKGQRRAIINEELIELTDNTDTQVTDGVVTGRALDPFLGIPHIDYSLKVRGKK